MTDDATHMPLTRRSALIGGAALGGLLAAGPARASAAIVKRFFPARRI
jgi:hypothetical protein